MKNKYFNFLVVTLLLLVFTQLFMYSTDLKSEDKLHQEQFNIKYGIFAIVQPEDLNFAGEEIPVYSSDIWERIDRELLKNTYWQSNTMLYFKKANSFHLATEKIPPSNEISVLFRL